MENRVRARLARGSIQVTVDLKQRDQATPPNLDSTVATANLRRIESLWSALFPQASLPEPAKLFETIMRLPPPPSPPPSKSAEECQRATFAALEDALEALERSREAEGAEIGTALLSHRDNLSRMRTRIAKRSTTATKAVQTRFIERINQLLAETKAGLTLDPETMLQESALYAEKADITEELARLEGHLGRFDEILGSSSEVGRRLEFLLQEMLREANTIGSKSLDLAISHDVVEVKAEIEKMKEQVQNLE
jgi:uncharacterized protein (TIGR00255 family)